MNATPFAFMVQNLTTCARRGRTFLTDDQVLELRQRRAQGAKRQELADLFGLSLAGVRSICEGRTRRTISP